MKPLLFNTIAALMMLVKRSPKAKTSPNVAGNMFVDYPKKDYGPEFSLVLEHLQINKKKAE